MKRFLWMFLVFISPLSQAGLEDELTGLATGLLYGAVAGTKVEVCDPSASCGLVVTYPGFKLEPSIKTGVKGKRGDIRILDASGKVEVPEKKIYIPK